VIERFRRKSTNVIGDDDGKDSSSTKSGVWNSSNHISGVRRNSFGSTREDNENFSSKELDLPYDLFGTPSVAQKSMMGSSPMYRWS
jgi:hypothetical protein